MIQTHSHCFHIACCSQVMIQTECKLFNVFSHIQMKIWLQKYCIGWTVETRDSCCSCGLDFFRSLKSDATVWTELKLTTITLLRQSGNYKQFLTFTPTGSVWYSEQTLFTYCWCGLPLCLWISILQPGEYRMAGASSVQCSMCRGLDLLGSSWDQESVGAVDNVSSMPWRTLEAQLAGWSWSCSGQYTWKLYIII